MLRAALLASLMSVPALVAAPIASHADAGGASPSPEVARARAAIKTMADTLRGELMAAIQDGGAVAAVGKCKAVAPGIARSASSASEGFIASRTALRVRNPQNKPDAFERRVLEDFAEKLKAGADPATLEHSEEIRQNDATLVRYMKAIPMSETPCVACHGASDKLDPAAAAEIRRLYPADQATGFAPGELRGAFSVTVRRK